MKDARYLVCSRCRKKWNVSAEAEIRGEYICPSCVSRLTEVERRSGGNKAKRRKTEGDHQKS